MSRRPAAPRSLPQILPLVVLAAVCLGMSACGGTSAPVGSSPPASSSSAEPPSSTPSESVTPSSDGFPAVREATSAGATRIDVPGAPDWISVAGGSAWTVTDGLARLDGKTGKVLSTTPLPGPVCLAMDVGFGSLWIGVCGAPPSLVRVDPATAKVVDTIGLPVAGLAEESSVAAGEGAVWLLSSTASIVRVSPKTGKVVGTFDVPSGASAVRAGYGALWVPDFSQNVLLRIDPASGKPTDSIPVGVGPRFLALGEGAVWVLNQTDGTVSQVDPTSRKVVATITVDSGPVDGGDMAAGGGFGWARVSDSLVAKIDPTTHEVVARYGPASGSGGVIADKSATWITAHDVDGVWRLPAGS